MEKFLQSLGTHIDLIILMIILSLSITLYKVLVLSSKNDSFKNLVKKMVTNLAADIIIVVSLLLFESFGMPVSPIIYLVFILMSESVMKWFIKKQDTIANRLMKKILELGDSKIIEDIKKEESKNKEDNSNE